MPDYQIGSTRLWGHASRDAFMQDVAEVQEARERARARAWKWLRMPIYTATPASSAVLIDSSSNGGAELGPLQGYAWSIRRIVIDGMTSGATPDVINMYRNAVTSQPPLWQFNGNNFGYTFGRLELVIIGGDALKFASVGTFAATGLIRVSGDVIEVPAEKLWELD